MARQRGKAGPQYPSERALTAYERLGTYAHAHAESNAFETFLDSIHD